MDNYSLKFFGSSCLQEKAKKVELFDENLSKLAKTMIEFMKKHNGVGLSANQIGSNAAMFVMDLDPKSKNAKECDYLYDGKKIPLEMFMPLACVNPSIEFDDEFIETSDEGCLSFPDIYAQVERPYKAKVSFQDLEGKAHSLESDAILGRCILHEFDHLNGINFIDRMKPNQFRKVQAKVKQLKRLTKKEKK